MRHLVSSSWPALLLGLLVTAPQVALGYELNTSSKGASVRWSAAEVEVDLAMADTPEELTREQAEAAILAALAVWSPHLPEDLALGIAAPEEGTLEADAFDRLNVVTWADDSDDPGYEPSALAVTYVTYRTNSGFITDADIVINAVNESWVVASTPKSDCGNAYDLQNVMTHEFGHFFGLGHSPDDQATMYATAAHCETDKRDLADDDIDGVESLYEGYIPGEDGGCGARVAGGGSGLGAVLLVLFAGFWAVRSRRGRGRWARASVVLGAGVGVLLWPAPASATLVRQLSVEQMTQASDAVAVGKVVSQRVLRSGRHIVTVSQVKVAECWTGTCGETIAVRQLGGEIDGVGMLVAGVAKLAVGDEVILFLRARTAQPMAVVGMAQGVFRVTKGTGSAVRDLRGLGVVSRAGRVREGDVERWSVRSLRTKVRGSAPTPIR